MKVSARGLSEGEKDISPVYCIFFPTVFKVFLQAPPELHLPKSKLCSVFLKLQLVTSSSSYFSRGVSDKVTPNANAEITHTHTHRLQVAGLFPATSHWNVAVNWSFWGLS